MLGKITCTQPFLAYKRPISYGLPSITKIHMLCLIIGNKKRMECYNYSEGKFEEGLEFPKVKWRTRKQEYIQRYGEIIVMFEKWQWRAVISELRPETRGWDYIANGLK